jgi:hypothetical protein
MFPQAFLLCSFLAVASSQPAGGKCHANEVLNMCGGCERTCANPTPMCAEVCGTPACRCAEEFVRSDNGTCIPQSECGQAVSTKTKRSPTCAENEVYRECATCEGTCDNPVPVCTKECKPAKCQCQTGHVRHEGKCIAQSKCGQAGPTKDSSPTCAENEVYRECATCEGTCANPDPVCTKECKPAQCQCKIGFVRDNGTCVEKKACVLVNPIRPAENDPCAVVRCADGPCEVKNGKAVCTKRTTRQEPNDPCATVDCAEGKKCVWTQINCFVAPCPQEPPKCVDINDTTQ